MATYIFNGECPSSIKQAFIDAYKPVPAYHADTWYKYANDTEWRTISIIGAISGSSGAPTSQIPKVTQIVALEIGSDVTNIGSYAFCDCSRLTSVTIPGSVTSIGDAAFHGCSRLEIVTIPNSVTKIDVAAFAYCHNLNNIVIPSDCILNTDAFRNCSSMSTITFENRTMAQVQSMNNYVFGLNWYKKEGNYVTITNIICSDGTIQMNRFYDNEPE